MAFRGRGRGRGRGGLQEIEGLVIQFKSTPAFPHVDLTRFTTDDGDGLLYKADQALMAGFKESVYYQQQVTQVADVERYSDRFKSAVAAKRSLATVTTDLAFFPDELHSVKDAKKIRTNPRIVTKDLDLDALERLAKQEEKQGPETLQDEQVSPEASYEEELEEDDNDYLIDYYEDDMDAFGGDNSDGGHDD